MRRSTAAIVGLLFLGLPGAAAPSRIEFTYTITNYPEDAIMESLMDGHRSEVRYEIRVYRKASGFRRLFGNRLIKQEETVYVARWDALDERYIVLIDGIREEWFESSQPFLRFFLSLSEYSMPVPSEMAENDYLVCRSRIQPIKLVPPLTLLTLIKPELLIVSPWSQITFEKADR